MNLQQLRYLVSAADTGSFSGAARREHVSQPVMSRALHGLERELGVVLFRREGRRLVLTETGNALVASARRALQAIDEFRATAALAAGGRDLVVTATPTNSTLLAPVLSGFIDGNPHLRVRLARAADSREVCTKVAEGNADLGFCDIDLEADAETAGLVCEPLWLAEVVVVSPADGDLPAVLPRARLADLPLVLPTPESGRREMIEGLVREAGGRPPSPVLATDERTAWATSAQHGIAAFVTYRAAASMLDHVAVSVLDPPLETTIGFVHRADGLTSDGRALVAAAHELEPPLGCRAF
jgi:DNA-binding transcriptional LysR family regulator